MSSGATVTIGAAISNQALVVGIKGAADAGRTADVLNITLAAEHAADADYAIVTAASVETININSTTGNDALTSDTNTLQVVATSAETINISGDMKFSLAVNATVANNFVALDTINASDNTAGVTITLAGGTANYANAVTITGTAKADTITGGDGKDVINAGAGNDTVNSSAGADVITLGAGSDTFDIGTAAHSSATSTAKVTDFVGGVDAIKFVAAASFEIVSGATITNAADLAAATTAAFALAATVNNAGIEALQFTYDSKTFFAIEASSTADATAAVVIDVTGLTGTVLASDFIA
jgi:Ca2+-binding RTX toxin-like protein